MSNSVYKFYYNILTTGGFALVDRISLNTENSDTIFVSHTIDSVKTDNLEVPFTITVSKNPVPYINEEEMVLVIREKVDFVARGPNYVDIKNTGKDIGKEDYKDYVPLRQSDLPSGFIEMKGINE